MKFFEAVKHVFVHYADFRGRARRSEYWYFWLFNFLVTGLIAIFARRSGFFRLIDEIYALATLIPGLAVLWRRMHDTNRSGLNVLWLLLPLVGWIILIVRLAKNGTEGSNDYGPDPKQKAFTGNTGEKAPWEL